MAMSSKKQIYHCHNCSKEIPFKGYTQYHKFCDNKCQLELRSKQTYEKNKKLFLDGKCKNRPAIRKILTEMKGYHCECCGIKEWQNNPLVLQVDHINGNPYDNSPNNLRLICPNCHSQTNTFAGANRGNGRWSKENLKRYYTTGQ